jgi:prepilin-type N-terminal cleavage/methylation domain-containing protein
MKIANNNAQLHRSKGVARCAAQQHTGFTLVEMMVTLAIMMLLFGIIFVPLNQAFNFFHLGQTRTSMQQAARQTLEQISSDLRTAVRVFPNDVTPGITNQPPYGGVGPYINGTSCSGGRLANLSRIDFIPAQLDSTGIVMPVRPARYVVTYYARRYDTDRNYNAIDNPVLLFRAQSPYLNGTNAEAQTPSGDPNLDVTTRRYSSNCNDRGAAWLMQQQGEPNFLVPLSGPRSTPAITSDTADEVVAGSHTRAIPLGVSLTATSRATLPSRDPDLNYTPLTTFTITDSNSDGKLDQVKINLALESYETSSTTNGTGDIPPPQILRMSTTVDLPNVM